jgi:bifunctional non-homologous end joining protein LigD
MIWTHRFEAVASASAALLCQNAVLDGEAIVLDADGRLDFAA